MPGRLADSTEPASTPPRPADKDPSSKDWPGQMQNEQEDWLVNVEVYTCASWQTACLQCSLELCRCTSCQVYSTTVQYTVTSNLIYLPLKFYFAVQYTVTDTSGNLIYVPLKLQNRNKVTEHTYV